MPHVSVKLKKKKEDLISFKLIDLESFDLYSTFSEASQFSGTGCSHWGEYKYSQLQKLNKKVGSKKKAHVTNFVMTSCTLWYVMDNKEFLNDTVAKIHT